MKKLIFNKVQEVSVATTPFYEFATIDLMLIRQLESAIEWWNWNLQVTEYTLTDGGFALKELKFMSVSLKKANILLKAFCGTSISPCPIGTGNILECAFPSPYTKSLFPKTFMGKEMAQVVESTMKFHYLKKEKSLVIKCNMKGVRTGMSETKANQQLPKNSFVTIGTQHRGIKKVLACCVNQNRNGTTNNMGNMFIGKPVLSWF